MLHTQHLAGHRPLFYTGGKVALALLGYHPTLKGSLSTQWNLMNMTLSFSESACFVNLGDNEQTLIYLLKKVYILSQQQWMGTADTQWWTRHVWALTSGHLQFCREIIKSLIMAPCSGYVQHQAWQSELCVLRCCTKMAACLLLPSHLEGLWPYSFLPSLTGCLGFSKLLLHLCFSWSCTHCTCTC